MSKKQIQMIPSGYIPTNPAKGYINPTWRWDQVNTNLGLNDSKSERLGGWFCSYSSAKANAQNVDGYSTYVLKNGQVKAEKITGYPCHPGHEEKGNKKHYYVDVPNGWLYQAKFDDKTFYNNENWKKCMKFFMKGTNGSDGLAYSYTMFRNSETDLEHLEFGKAVNDDPRKYFWASWGLVWDGYNSSLCYKSGGPVGTFREQTLDPRKLKASRAKNVVGFSLNAFLQCNKDNSGLFPHTISLIMIPQKSAKFVVVTPKVKTGNSMRLEQNWEDFNKDSSHIKNWRHHTTPDLKDEREKVLNYTYVCSPEDTQAIIDQRMEFVGINVKMVKHGQGGTEVHVEGTCYIWNFKPLCCDSTGVMSNTWNTGRYNVWPYPNHTDAEMRDKFRISYA